MSNTTTTYRLRSKLGHQRKFRVFAEYEVGQTPRGQFATVSYFDYKTGKLENHWYIDASSIGAAILRWTARPGCSVQYTHYEEAD